MEKKLIKLILEDGTEFKGSLFGYPVSVAGEIVFNTAMTGYPESLTDPSYKGQILVATYPLIGNYGVPSAEMKNNLFEFYESDKIHVEALVISQYSEEYSHWNADKSLHDWMYENQIPGIYGLDTRKITQIIREKGSMSAKIIVDEEIDFVDISKINLVDRVSIRGKETYGDGLYKILLVDCGVKNNIIRRLLAKNASVIRVPWDYPFLEEDYDGLFISNGPGDPEQCQATILNLQNAIGDDKPIFGICLGHQLLSLAAGAKTYKLKYGHRSHNQPVFYQPTRKAYITSQNHGYAVDESSLGKEWEPTFRNLNDDTNEGIRHLYKPIFSTQFHPEASGGPTDTDFLFDDFMEMVKMKKMQNKPHKVLLIGSGALKIGEAGEFDYSGSQALKALKEEGVSTVLINPNIATVQTTEKLADKVYLLPVTAHFVERVIEKEKPDGILLSFGGQTALNVGLEIEAKGILKKHNVTVLGTPTSAIKITEDRQLFADLLRSIDVETPKSFSATTMEEAFEAVKKVGFPIIVRAAFTLGGQGSGFCSNEKELRELAQTAFSFSDQILIEESLKGWKEVEYEVVRDKYDNCITVCNMENFDPLGIHTGESIVVAPSQTLSNSEYHKLREVSIKIIRNVGVIGECNVQFALDPNSEEYRVIEVNARLSRSSALASKATGYPLAFVAAKLGLGYGLHEIKNSITKTTSAFFEPSLDYVICKLPRWDLTKFTGVDRNLGSSMKSVGEVMAIGRSFEEAIQKGLRMIGVGMHGFTANQVPLTGNIEDMLQNPTDMRIFYIADAFKSGMGVEKVHQLTGIDKWFLTHLYKIIQTEKELSKLNSLQDLDAITLKNAKQTGFSDFQLARIVLKSTKEQIDEDLITLRKHRIKQGVKPVVKQIDTLAAEFPAYTNYLYLTYHGDFHDVEFEKDDKSVVVLGSGAYRIGSSVEFDWAGVNTVESLKRNNYRGVIINFNPETVSTDYDISDRLFFEELSLERVMDIVDLESPKGVIVSVGGQIPNTLAPRLAKEGISILGTSPQSIDRAEDRFKFSEMLDKLKIDQPRWKELSDLDEIARFVEEVGFPILIRPSYVLSGAAMNVVSNSDDLYHFLEVAATVSKQHPVVVSEFITNSKEIEFDAVAQNGEIKLYAISEHIEFAGVHSGDATLVFPPQKVYFETIRRIKKVARQIAEELHISGPFNIQFLARDNFIKVIECNLRASRSFPFVSKVLNENFIDVATKVMLGQEVQKPEKSIFDIEHIGIKASQFSFSRLTQADPVLGVDMSSTGEVGCIGDSYYEAVLKAMLSVGYKVPQKGVLISSGDARSKVELLMSSKMMVERGLKLYATPGTHDFLSGHGVESEKVYWPDDERSPNALKLLEDQLVDLVVNIPKNLTSRELNNDFTIRRNAVDRNIPILTNARLASAFIISFCSIDVEDFAIKSLGEYEIVR